MHPVLDILVMEKFSPRRFFRLKTSTSVSSKKNCQKKWQAFQSTCASSCCVTRAAALHVSIGQKPLFFPEVIRTFLINYCHRLSKTFIKRNGYCSWDIYLQSVKASRSVTSLIVFLNAEQESFSCIGHHERAAVLFIVEQAC